MFVSCENLKGFAVTPEILAWKRRFHSFYGRWPYPSEIAAYLLGRIDEVQSCEAVLAKRQEEEQRAMWPRRSDAVTT